MYKRIGKFIAEWAHPLGLEECPYAYRWRLDFYWFSFRIHKWISSDDTRAFHNHPWHFITFVLKGYYYNNSPAKYTNWNPIRTIVRWGAIRHKDHKHYVEIIESPVWTFVITFGAPRKYAFWIGDKRKNRDKYFIEHGHMPCD